MRGRKGFGDWKRSNNMDCNLVTQANAYYDGELPSAERIDFEKHLEVCEDCRRLVSDLREVSALVTSAPGVEMPSGLIDRLQASRRASEDRVILRLAGWLTATAAGILIASLLSWPTNGTDVTAQPAIWESVAVRPSYTMNDNPDSDLLVAQWMADDLGSAKNGDLQ